MTSNTRIPKNVGASISSRYDDRAGLGYGQLAQKFHKTWELPQSYPYTQPDDAEDVIESEDDDDTRHAIDKKIADFQKTDSLAFKGANRMYFVGATTNLAACFERPDDVLEEIAAASRGIVAIPGLYGKSISNGPSIGGAPTNKAFDTRSFKRTGTKQGWSESPPLSKVAMEDEESAEEEFYTLDDLAKIQRPSLGECLGIYVHT